MLVPLLSVNVPDELIENRKILQPTQSITFDGLNGETDGFYRLIYKIKNDGIPVFPDVVVYDIRPNGIITNQHTVRWSVWWSSTQLDQFSFWLVGGGDAQAVCAGEMLIYAASSVADVPLDRYFTGHFTTFGDLIHLGCHTSGRWADNTTPITSFSITATHANGIGKGSEFSLSRVGR